jgi:hypothetical protein
MSDVARQIVLAGGKLFELPSGEEFGIFDVVIEQEGGELRDVVVAHTALYQLGEGRRLPRYFSGRLYSSDDGDWFELQELMRLGLDVRGWAPHRLVPIAQTSVCLDDSAKTELIAALKGEKPLTDSGSDSGKETRRLQSDSGHSLLLLPDGFVTTATALPIGTSSVPIHFGEYDLTFGWSEE